MLIQTNFTKLEVLLSNFAWPTLPCENDFTFQVYRKRPTMTIVGFWLKTGSKEVCLKHFTWFLDEKMCSETGWQKLHGGTGGPRQKVWTRTKILSPNIRYFVAIYALFGDLWAKKVPFWVKNSVSGARSALLYGVYCIFYWVKGLASHCRAKTTYTFYFSIINA